MNKHRTEQTILRARVLGYVSVNTFLLTFLLIRWYSSDHPYLVDHPLEHRECCRLDRSDPNPTGNVGRLCNKANLQQGNKVDFSKAG
jgi:hypothetical protein